jgi:hypothetical protein
MSGEAKFSVAEWLSLDAAFAGAIAALGSSHHALLDLRGHLLSGRLPSAVRWFERDGTEGFELLASSAWRVLILREHIEPQPDGSARRTGTLWVRNIAATRIAATATDTASLWFVVSRRHYDELYADGAPASAAAAPKRNKGRKISEELEAGGIAFLRPKLAAAQAAQAWVSDADAAKWLRAEFKVLDKPTISDRYLTDRIIRPARRPAADE